jgi:hypothetical protein
MTIFDLLFFLLVLGTLVTFIIICVLFIRHKTIQGFIAFIALVIVIGIYISIIIIVSLNTPQLFLAYKQIMWSDDWGISVESVSINKTGTDKNIEVTFAILSRALRTPQKERNVDVFIVDENEKQYRPERGSSYAPFDSILQPGQRIEIQRTFSINTPGQLGLIIKRFNRFPGLFIIGDNSSILHKQIIFKISDE